MSPEPDIDIETFYLDAYQQTQLKAALDPVDRDLLHLHLCVGPDPHVIECRTMICRDQKLHRCWEHRMREPNERPR